MLTLAAAASRAETLPASPTPVERSDDLLWKATASAYLVSGHVSGDANLRRQVGPVFAWVGLFHDPGIDTVARVGAEYDWRRGPVLVVPTIVLATNGLQAGQLYAELGSTNYVIAGFSRTNLRPYYNLSFDPNESVQLGLGRHLSRFDRVYAFTIFDVRLHTGQQDTHLVWRHRLGGTAGLTLDGLYKSGRTDSGRYVHALGLGAYLDRPHWFAKAYYDPYVNFSEDTMFRLGIGGKF
jgi:hypothetical protein